MTDTPELRIENGLSMSEIAQRIVDVRNQIDSPCDRVRIHWPRGAALGAPQEVNAIDLARTVAMGIGGSTSQSQVQFFLELAQEIPSSMYNAIDPVIDIDGAPSTPITQCTAPRRR